MSKLFSTLAVAGMAVALGLNPGGTSQANASTTTGTKYFSACDPTGHCARMKVEVNLDSAPVPGTIRGNGYVTCYNGSGDYPCTEIDGYFRFVNPAGHYDVPKSCDHNCPLYLYGSSPWFDMFAGCGNLYYYGGDFYINTGSGTVHLANRTDMLNLCYP